MMRATSAGEPSRCGDECADRARSLSDLHDILPERGDRFGVPCGPRANQVRTVEKGAAMWDLQTALQAVAVVAIGTLFVPPVGRAVGGFCAVIGLCGVMQSRTWAPTVMALGLVAWFVGHWSFAVRHDVVYRTNFARIVIDKTPLKWTIPRYWQLRRETDCDADQCESAGAQRAKFPARCLAHWHVHPFDSGACCRRQPTLGGVRGAAKRGWRRITTTTRYTILGRCRVRIIYNSASLALRNISYRR
jgi:hypothetical protein